MIAGGFAALYYLVAAAAPLDAGTVAWRDWVVVFEGHTDIRTNYEPGEDAWTMLLDRGDDGVPGQDDELLTPDRSILLLTEDAKRTLESDPSPGFSFLGEEGDSYYRIITDEIPGVVYLGFNGYGVPENVFEGNFGGEFFLELIDFDGPGDFLLYARGADILMDTRGDEPPHGEKREFAREHSHENWFFREPGIYLLELRPYATFDDAEGAVSQGDPHQFFFLVDPRPIEWWQLDSFRDEARSPVANPGADAAGDGRQNLLAYALGYPPTEAADPYLPQPEVVQTDEGEHLSLVFRKPKGEPGRDDRGDVVYRVQISTDLDNWTDLETGPENWIEIDPAPDGVRRVRALDSDPLSEHERRFIRLTVELLPRED